MDGYDEEFSEAPLDEDALAQVAGLADQQLELELGVIDAEEVLKRANKALREVSDHALPLLMNQLGLEKFTTTAGTKISIKDVLRVSTTGKYRPAIMKWLRENDLQAIISRVVALEFGQGEDEKADAVVKELKKLDLQYTDGENINAMTFKATVREMLEAGVAVPIEEIGVSRFYQSKIER